MSNDTALFRPVTITFETLDRLTREKSPSDLIGLYMSYVAVVQWQQTTTVKATTDFMAQRLGWGRDKVIRTKKKLEALGLVVSVARKDEKGKVTGHFVRIMYVITSSVQSSQKPEGGLVHTVDSKDTSTINKQLSTNNSQLNALLTSIIDLVNPKEKATDDRRRQLRARLKDYTEEEILGAARALSQSAWHREHKQMSVDNLLAPSKFGRWYAQRTDQVGSGDAYGYHNGKKIVTEDDDGNQYWGGERITPQNQDRVLKEQREQ